MDRASGSGVFARDPDAMIDLTEIELNENIVRLQEQKSECAVYFKYIKRFVNDIDEAVSQDDLESAYNMRKIAEETLPKNTLALAREEYQNSRKTIQSQSAWQIEGTLREFPKFKPIYCWFDYPIHKIDDTGILKDVTDNLNSKNSNWKKNFSNKKTLISQR